MIAFTVLGVAQSKGSMRAFTPRGMKFPIVTDSNRNVRSWQQLVSEGANQALQHGAHVMHDGAVRVTVTFHLPRPKKYQRRGLAVAHTKAPDLDKLVRAVLDALAAIAYHDDAQVVELVAAKYYADVDTPARCDVHVEQAAARAPLFAGVSR
jgi:Holliday junction resolvase RusA-like endonuclease